MRVGSGCELDQGFPTVVLPQASASDLVHSVMSINHGIVSFCRGIIAQLGKSLKGERRETPACGPQSHEDRHCLGEGLGRLRKGARLLSPVSFGKPSC